MKKQKTLHSRDRQGPKKSIAAREDRRGPHPVEPTPRGKELPDRTAAGFFSPTFGAPDDDD